MRISCKAGGVSSPWLMEDGVGSFVLPVAVDWRNHNNGVEDLWRKIHEKWRRQRCGDHMNL